MLREVSDQFIETCLAGRRAWLRGGRSDVVKQSWPAVAEKGATAGVGPIGGRGCSFAEKGVGGRSEVFAGVENVEDLRRGRKFGGGRVPDRLGTAD